MDFSVGQVPDYPAVNRSETKFAALRALTRVGNIVEYPGNFACRKVRVGNKTCRFANVVRKTVALEFFDNIGGSAALPYYRVKDGFTGRRLPNYRRFALIGYTYRGDLVGTRVDALHRLHSNAHLRRPYIPRVVLNPARFRVVLLKFALSNACDISVFVEKNGARTRRALVHSYNVLFFAHNCILSVFLNTIIPFYRKKARRPTFFSFAIDLLLIIS